MPVPPHFKIVFRGRFNNTPEIWSHSHNLRRPSNLANPDLSSDVEQIDLGALRDAWTAMAANTLAQHVRLTDVRAYSIGTDGRMVGNPHLLEIPTANEPSGGVANPRHPPQIALCVTCEAPNRGAGRFGRYFLPGPAVELQDDLRMTAVQAQGIANAQRTFLLAMRDSYSVAGAPDTTDVNPVNVSMRGGNGAGSQQNITTVRVGRVLDTIRSRRNQMDEGYQVAAL